MLSLLQQKGLPVKVCKECGKVKKFGQWLMVTKEYLERIEQYGTLKITCENCRNDQINAAAV